MNAYDPRRGMEPRKWGGRKNRKPDDALTLAEAAVLRRMRDGARNVDVARELRWRPSEVASVLYGARMRFGNMKTTKELLSLPRILELLSEYEKDGNGPTRPHGDSEVEP